MLVCIGEVGFHPSFSLSRAPPLLVAIHWLYYEYAGSPHILIVDDHREIRDLVSRALSKEGFRLALRTAGSCRR